jgi:hypothetical protein
MSAASADDLEFSPSEAAAESLPTNLRIRLDRAHPRMARTEESLRSLRQRIEHQVEQEEQLHRLYQGWQQNWSFQCDQLQRQVARLEAYLTAWYPREDNGCQLSVVEGD